MKKKSFTILLIMAWLLFPLMSIVVVGNGKISPSASMIFSHGEITHVVHYQQGFDESIIMNSSGEHETFSTYSMAYEKDGYWIKEDRSSVHKSNYTIWETFDIKGNMSLDINIDAFSVQATYEDTLKFIWMAVKNGSIHLEQFITDYKQEINTTMGYHDLTNITYTKYDLETQEFIETWDEVEEQQGVDDFYFFMESDWKLRRAEVTYEFTAPMFLVMQVYETPENESVAWADFFWEYIIYEDINLDSIYTLQGTHVYNSKEGRGLIFPWAKKVIRTTETFYADPMMDTSYTYIHLEPRDKTLEELTSSIEINHPELDGSALSWGIQYPEYPAEWWAMGCGSSANASYVEMSPASYSYDFQYTIADGEADFDYTVKIPKITNNTFYNNVQQLSLSLPHLSYFVSSSEVKEDSGGDLSTIEDEFAFLINDSAIAEITMVKKKEYQIYDYPTIGTITTVNSTGGSANKMTKSTMESMYDPYDNQIHSLLLSFPETDLVKNDPAFSSNNRLFTITTQNYPIWSGEKIIHDPTLIIYFKSDTFDQPMGVIGDISSLLMIFGIVGITVVILRSRLRSRMKDT